MRKFDTLGAVKRAVGQGEIKPVMDVFAPGKIGGDKYLAFDSAQRGLDCCIELLEDGCQADVHYFNGRWHEPPPKFQDLRLF